MQLLDLLSLVHLQVAVKAWIYILRVTMSTLGETFEIDENHFGVCEKSVCALYRKPKLFDANSL